MGTGQGPPKQQQYAAYPPQQPQYYVQQPSPPKQPQPQPQHQQYQPYQPPQQPQYYFPPQQQQQYDAASPTSPAAPAAPAAPQQHFLAELDAPQSTAPPKSRPTSSASSAPPPAAGQDASGDSVFEMSAEPVAAKPEPPRPVSAAPSTPSPGAQQKPLVQANPWGFFLPDDAPDRVDSASPPGKDGNADEMLAVKPLRIVKTGPSSNQPNHGAGEAKPDAAASPASSPQSIDAAAQPVLRPEQMVEVETGRPAQQDASASSDPAQLAPAPLNIARPHPPAAQQQHPVSTGASPVVIPPAGTYPPQSPISPMPGHHPSPGAQVTLPIHPCPHGGSSVSPLSVPATAVVTPLTPAQTGQSPQLQPQYSQAPPPQAYTQATPASAVFVQPALPPTLPMGSYFPQQPSYARPEPAPTASAHHSPAASVSSTAQEAAQIAQQLTNQQYASPPPSYDQAVSQGRPNASPAPSQTQLYQSPAATPLSPHLTGTAYPYSPSDIGALKPAHNPSPTNPQSYPYTPHAQPSYVNGPQGYQPNAPPLPPRTSPPTPGYGQHANPYGPPPTRPNYVAPAPGPAKSNSGLFSSATARKLLSKTTDFVDQTITPYLQDHRYRPPYNQYQYQYQYQCQYQYQYPPGRPLPPGQYYQQQGYNPAQPTYAAPQTAHENPNKPRPA